MLEIIDILFSFTVNPQTLKKEITINPSLTEKSLQAAVESTRNIIIELYITCEEEFLSGLQIFEAIVAKQIMETSTEQVESLKSLSEKHLSEAAKIADNIGKPAEKENAPVPEVEIPTAEPVKVEEPSKMPESQTSVNQPAPEVEEKKTVEKEDVPPAQPEDKGVTETDSPKEEVLDVNPERQRLVVDVNESGQRQLRVAGGSKKHRKAKKRLTRKLRFT